MRNKFLSGIFIFVLLLSIAFAGEDNYGEIFKQGNDLYGKGDFKGALACYKKIADNGIVDGEVYYNLGNAYFKTGNLSKAILYYERALKLLPRDREIRENLNYSRSLTADKQIMENSGFVNLLLSGMDGYLSMNELTVVALFIYFIVFCFLLLYIFLPPSFALHIKIALLSLVIPFIFFSLSLGIRIHTHETMKGGIIMSREVKARSGPGDDYTEVFSIHSGSTVFLRNSQGDWSQIILINGYSGWVKNNTLEEI